MGRQNSDPAIVGPSITLLQERFKKLERIKEKRAERRQIMFSEPKGIVPTNYVSYSSFSGELLFLPSPASDQDPLSLGINLNNKHADYGALNETRSPSSFLWSADKRGVKTPQMFDISGVDTSLHL